MSQTVSDLDRARQPREQMVTALQDSGQVRSEAVAAALRAVPTQRAPSTRCP